MVRENGMVMISEEEYRRLNRDSEDNKVLRSAIIKLLKQIKSNPTEDVELTMREFLVTYNAAVADMFENEDNGIDDNEIYGYDVTVHWHGVYCNCEDGATPTNTVIDGVEACADECGY